METCFHDLRAAINLSNTAILLLQRQCYEQAHATLEDAVMLIVKGVLVRYDHVSDPRRTMMCANSMIEPALANAAARVAHQCPFTQQAVDLSVVSTADATPRMILESIDLCKHQFPKQPFASLVFQIESLSLEEINLNSSIILFNYATSAQCLASITGQPTRQHQLQTRAFHVYYLAYKSAYENFFKGPEDIEELNHLLLVVTPTLHNLAQYASILGMESRAKQFFDRFSAYREALVTTQELDLVANHVAPAA